MATNLPKSASPSEPSKSRPYKIGLNVRLMSDPVQAGAYINAAANESKGVFLLALKDVCEAYLGATDPQPAAPDSINYLEIHHTDGRVKVWYGEEAQGRFRGIDHDPTTREEWKRMAGEGVRTVEALTTNSGERQAEREEAMDAIERVIEMADSYKTASQMTLSDARNALKYFRASAAPLSQMPAERLADDAIGLFLEYRDKHGYDEESARASVVREVIDASQPQPSVGQTEGK